MFSRESKENISMRQVDRDELAYTIVNGLRPVTASMWKRIADPCREVRDQAKAVLAGIIADALGRYQVLSDHPAAPAQAFSRPLARMLGETTETGGVPINVGIPTE
jgi:hypothetical protein